MAQARDPLGIVGTTIDRRYVVRRFVAEGGYGFVYEAEAEKLGVPVALKFLRGELGRDATSDARARFEQEARVLARLKHPAIVELTDAAHLEDGTPYLVLAWIDGETLDARIQREGPATIESALALLAPVASAIELAHSQGVIHRDLKPSNLMIGTTGAEDAPSAESIKVLDFGVARWTSAQGVHTTTTSTTGLSIGYAAPEQYGKEFGPVDGRADQFALAAIVYSVLTAKAPFEGQSLTEVMFATCYAKERPSLEKELGAGHGLSAVDDVLRRALAIRPDDRFPSIRTFFRALVDGSVAEGRELPEAPTTQPGSPPVVSRSKPVVAAAIAIPTHTLPSPDFQRPGPPSLGHAPTVRAEVVPAPEPPPSPAFGTTREGELPSASFPDSSPPSSVASRPAARRVRRVVVVLAVGCIVGAGAYAAQPILFPAMPSTSRAPKPVASPPKTASARPSTSAADQGPCGELGEGEACVLGGKLHRGPDDCTESDPAHRAACPVQIVSVAAFAIDKREVTNVRYRACISAGKCRVPSVDGADALPVRGVTHGDGVAFCKFDHGKRLPTDDEWELAAASLSHRAYPWGNEQPSAKLAIYSSEGTPRTTPVAVGSAPGGATPDGLLDLGGNVAEWTGTAAAGAPPLPAELEGMTSPPAGTRRWVRGGSYASGWDALRTWAREAFPETYASPTIGLRCARGARK